MPDFKPGDWVRDIFTHQPGVVERVSPDGHPSVRMGEAVLMCDRPGTISASTDPSRYELAPKGEPKVRSIKLTDADWANLERIARREHLERGGVPIRSEAMRWLIARDSG